MTENILLTVKDTCKLLSISRSSLYELIKEGALPIIKIGRSTRIRRSDIEKFVADLTAERDNL